jgi:hypothetical protein
MTQIIGMKSLERPFCVLSQGQQRIGDFVSLERENLKRICLNSHTNRIVNVRLNRNVIQYNKNGGTIPRNRGTNKNGNEQIRD